MPKINTKIGLTLKLFKDSAFEFIRPEIGIEGIDIEGDVDKQLESAFLAIEKSWEMNKKAIDEVVLSEMPQVNAQMEMQVITKLKVFEEELAKFKKALITMKKEQ